MGRCRARRPMLSLVSRSQAPSRERGDSYQLRIRKVITNRVLVIEYEGVYNGR